MNKKKADVWIFRRFDPSFRALRERVVSGSLGALRMVRTSSRDYSPPSPDYIKTSGGQNLFYLKL